MRPPFDALSLLRWSAGACVAILLAFLAGGPSSHVGAWLRDGFGWYSAILSRDHAALDAADRALLSASGLPGDPAVTAGLATLAWLTLALAAALGAGRALITLASERHDALSTTAAAMPAPPPGTKLVAVAALLVAAIVGAHIANPGSSAAAPGATAGIYVSIATVLAAIAISAIAVLRHRAPFSAHVVVGRSLPAPPHLPERVPASVASPPRIFHPPPASPPARRDAPALGPSAPRWTGPASASPLADEEAARTLDLVREAVARREEVDAAAASATVLDQLTESNAAPDAPTPVRLHTGAAPALVEPAPGAPHDGDLPRTEAFRIPDADAPPRPTADAEWPAPSDLLPDAVPADGDDATAAEGPTTVGEPEPAGADTTDPATEAEGPTTVGEPEPAGADTTAPATEAEGPTTVGEPEPAGEDTTDATDPATEAEGPTTVGEPEPAGADTTDATDPATEADEPTAVLEPQPAGEDTTDTASGPATDVVGDTQLDALGAAPSDRTENPPDGGAASRAPELSTDDDTITGGARAAGFEGRGNALPPDSDPGPLGDPPAAAALAPELGVADEGTGGARAAGFERRGNALPPDSDPGPLGDPPAAAALAPELGVADEGTGGARAAGFEGRGNALPPDSDPGPLGDPPAAAALAPELGVADEGTGGARAAGFTYEHSGPAEGPREAAPPEAPAPDAPPGAARVTSLSDLMQRRLARAPVTLDTQRAGVQLPLSSPFWGHGTGPVAMMYRSGEEGSYHLVPHLAPDMRGLLGFLIAADMFGQAPDFTTLGEFLYPHGAPRADFFDDARPDRARHLFWRTRDAMRLSAAIPASESPFVESDAVSRIHLDRRYVLTDLRLFAMRRDEARRVGGSEVARAWPRAFEFIRGPVLQDLDRYPDADGLRIPLLELIYDAAGEAAAVLARAGRVEEAVACILIAASAGGGRGVPDGITRVARQMGGREVAAVLEQAQARIA